LFNEKTGGRKSRDTVLLKLTSVAVHLLGLIEVGATVVVDLSHIVDTVNQVPE
jgi:hypothetical protein